MTGSPRVVGGSYARQRVPRIEVPDLIGVTEKLCARCLLHACRTNLIRDRDGIRCPRCDK